jgi:hypothetical protein
MIFVKIYVLMGTREKGNNGARTKPPSRKLIIKAKSKRQVRRYLKNPLAKTSAVIYFTGNDQRPFILSPKGGGISSGGEFKLTKKWKLSKDKLDRIFIIASEEDVLSDDGEGEEEDE